MIEPKILSMPDRVLSGAESDDVFRHIFSDREQGVVAAIGRLNELHFARADMAAVYCPTVYGYLGDSIEGSRVVDPLRQKYGDKVYVVTPRPDFMSGHPLVVDQDKKGTKYLVKDSVDAEPTKRTFKRHMIVPGISDYVVPARFLQGNKPEFMRSDLKIHLDLDRIEYIHQLQLAQILWERLYGLDLKEMPKTAVGVSVEARENGESIHDSYPQGKLNLVIHPDASNEVSDELYRGKRWEAKKWVKLIDSLQSNNPDMSVFVSTGRNHPGASKQIDENYQGSRERVHFLPGMELADYIGFVDSLPKDRTIFLGLESMPAGHLAPALGLKSIVLGDERFYCRFYGPWGGIVVANQGPGLIHEELRVDVVEKAFEMTKERLSASIAAPA